MGSARRDGTEARAPHRGADPPGHRLWLFLAAFLLGGPGHRRPITSALPLLGPPFPSLDPKAPGITGPLPPHRPRPAEPEPRSARPMGRKFTNTALKI